MTHQYNVQPCVPGAEDLYYSGSDCEERCVGHLRGDFGSEGDAFYTSWTPHAAWESVDDRFTGELNAVIESLRPNMLRSRNDMRAYIRQHPTVALSPDDPRPYGYQVITAEYQYCLRCTPARGGYDLYVYCYRRDKK